MKPDSRTAGSEQHAIGVDIGGTTTKVALVTRAGEFVAMDTVPTALDRGVDAYLAGVFDKVDSLISLIDAHGAPAGIGIAVAGFVDPPRERMFYNPNLRPLEHAPLKQSFADRFRLPVHLDADSNAACLAEYLWGAGRGSRRFLCIVVGTGVGGGMIVNGEIVRLAHGGLGDIGHVIVEPGGPECAAGCHGCAEALVPAPAIESRAQTFAPGATLRDVIEQARSGDERCRALLAGAGSALGIALASQTVITFPDRIAIAGGLAEAGDLVLRPAAQTFEHTIGPFYRTAVEIVRGELGWKAGAAGAAALALRP